MKSLDRFSGKLNEADIAERAHHYRRAFGISDIVYVDIIDLLEFKVSEFISDFRLMVRRDIDLAYAAETTIDPPRIYVRESIYDSACEGDPDSRRILAHELGHLLLHNNITGPMQKNFNGYEEQIIDMNSLESTEDQADIFARNFLAPVYLAFSYRNDIGHLAKISGTPRNIAAASVTISKRQEMYKLRNYKFRR